MSRPTAKHPAMVHSTSDAANQSRGWLGHLLGETSAEPAARVDGRVNVYRLVGETGSGLLANATDPLGEPAGTYRTRTSVWAIGADRVTYQIELVTHDWDAWSEASQSGDRRWLEVPRRVMYAERDRRTAQLDAELDHAQLFSVPERAVPALGVGLDPARVRALALEHAPELLAGRAQP